jgi:hypothetical protein
MTDSDFVWAELARHPIRRAMLGRERCDEITATARSKMPPDRVMVAARGSNTTRYIRSDVERQVRDEYAQRAGFAFMTMLIMWAIGAIVQALVKKWWEEHT